MSTQFFTLTCCQLIFVVIEEEFEVSFLTGKYASNSKEFEYMKHIFELRVKGQTEERPS